MKDALKPLIFVLNSMPSGCDAELPMTTALFVSYNNKYLDFTIPILDSNVVVPVGGRLSHFVTAWRSLTNDPWVLRIIEE